MGTLNLNINKNGKYEVLGGVSVERTILEQLEQQVTIRKESLLYLFLKRAVDIMVSLCALIVLTPILIVISVLIKIESRGPVIFKQNRVGINSKEFTIYKFRSMKVGSPEVASNSLKNYKDHVTKIGKFIRKTSLDELPQLINVIKGDMSLVGPRPVISSEIELLEFRRKFGIDKALPGITGWAQVNGRDNMNVERKIYLVNEYNQNRNFFFDIKILFMTLKKVISRDGAI